MNKENFSLNFEKCVLVKLTQNGFQTCISKQKMCGISAILFAQNKEDYECFYKDHIEELLNNRGPNGSKTLFSNDVYYAATVLWHQGNFLTSQPISIDDGQKILLFNGDLFMDFEEGSDTSYLVQLLTRAENDDDLLDIFKHVTGPFSIIYYFNNSLYFIRDSLGRNSLMIGKVHETLFLTSVIDSKNSNNFQCMEVPPLGLYKIQLDTKSVDLFPFKKISHEHHLEQFADICKMLNIDINSREILPLWMIHSQLPITKTSFDALNLEQIDPSNIFDHLLSIPKVNDLCDQFLYLLTKSVQDRVLKTQKQCKNCLSRSEVTCNHCNVAILFSGGVDCTLLTILAHKFIDANKPIDLLNVAFEKVNNKSENGINFNVPDRLTGLATLDELQHLYPQRKWNFLEINIKRSEISDYRNKLTSLVYPLANVLDESLGIAIYFASRGHGTLNGHHYESPSRVILMGSGADELFGGYTRHRNAYKRSTSDNDLLTKELELDWIRLPSRNLARDDRVVGDNGITVRAPYVEENFVNFARSLTAMQRCFLKLPEGIGDKLLLRLCAYRMGLHKCSQFRKRALQFGSRIADQKQSAKDKSKLFDQNVIDFVK